MSASKPLTSVLVKPAGPDCNMRCTYCFYLEKTQLYPATKSHRMSEEILEDMIQQVMTQAGTEVSFGWQGGEPTLMGLAFFQRAVEFQQKHGKNQTVGNGLQTNGLLLDARWADFLRSYRFLVGLSLDGPEHVHDRYRRQAGGQGSWKSVVEKASLLLDEGVEVNALTVVNDHSVQFPDEIYTFHKGLGLNHMQFIPCVETNPDDPGRTAPFSVSSEDYGRFLIALFDRWMSDFEDGKPTTSIRFFESLFYTYVGLPPPQCTLLEECGDYIVVEHNGDVYACDFFVEPEWKLGNIREGRLIDMLNSPRQRAFGKQKERRPDRCSRCSWLTRCWGGCIKDRIKDPHPRHENYLCRSFMMFFEHADERMRTLAEDWKSHHGWNESAGESQRRICDEKVGRNDPCPCGSGKKSKHCCGR